MPATQVAGFCFWVPFFGSRVFLRLRTQLCSPVLAGKFLRSTASRAMAIAVEDAEVGAPGAYGWKVLEGEDARELVQVGEIVHGPGGEQLGQGYDAEFGMTAAALEVFRLQVHGMECSKIFRTQTGKLVEQLIE